MDRINQILNDRQYQEFLNEIALCEKERIFCRHNMAHFLDVARLAWIFNLEEHMGLERERIYAAALLHDIGRHLQYQEGIPHETASAKLAEPILERCGFSGEEKKEILQAISDHRTKEIAGQASLSGILYRADKMSRSCFGCQAESQCDWSAEKKNMMLRR
ncbi:MAG: HD domain-containing protein [Lachnospiraceae bacterium]|nr:HD domain-containing protein [Robinsoniella sp.]MDY3766552.1 HD domain-containing protein [Lachnospiraceae bacterium]